MGSPLLLKRLQMIERAVQQNAYHRQQLDYKDLPDVPPLRLVSSERANVVESVDQLFGGFGGLGRSAMMKSNAGVGSSTVGGVTSSGGMGLGGLGDDDRALESRSGFDGRPDDEEKGNKKVGVVLYLLNE